MPVQLTGLGGFDSGMVIQQLVDIAKKPISELESKKSLVDSAGVTLNSFSTKLGALKTAATALSTISGFTSMGATSSDTSIVTSTTGSPPPGSYSVNVTQLARVQKSRGNVESSATTALNDKGTLSFTIGTGTPIDISIVQTDTLADIASKINASGARLSANVISTGTGYRLNIQGLDTGAANAFTVQEKAGLNLGITRYETAQDANLTVDGLAITRPTNQITEAIPGVTLALTKTTTSPATITLAGDSTQLKTKINAFVTAYNDVVNAGHQATGWGTSKASNSVLAADPAIRRSLDRIARLVSGPVTGASATYKSFASVGLALGKDGVMAFDATKFDAAISKDPAAVQKLFITDTSMSATGLMKNITDTVTSLITPDNGAIKARISALQAQSKRIAESKEKKLERIDEYEKQLRKQFSDLDIAMSRYQSMAGALNSIG